MPFQCSDGAVVTTVCGKARKCARRDVVRVPDI